MTQIKISGELKLGQLLKIAHLIETGGEAKHFVSSHEILINNRVAGGRNAKIVIGDVVTIKNKQYQIVSK